MHLIHNSDKILHSKLLSLKDKTEWSEYLNKLPLSVQDVYYSPEYYDIFEKNGDGKAFCFIFDDGANIALYPFLMNRINDLGYKLDKDYYDIQGAYGYNGVISSSEDRNFIKSFYNEFTEFCNNNNIIAEFTRFHPLIKNYNFSKDFLNISFNRHTVYVDLTLNYGDIYKNYKKDVKENLRTAYKNNLTVLIYKNEFPYKNNLINMYNENMDSFKARDYLHFNDEFFNNTFYNLPLTQFVVLKDNVPIVSIICIYRGIYLHAHLSGSKKEYFPFRPINLIFDHMIRYGLEKGFCMLHLGGGRTVEENDSLLSFKRNHSKTLAEFYIGSNIYNNFIYNNICDQWAVRNPHLLNTYDKTILKYRYTK